MPDEGVTTGTPHHARVLAQASASVADSSAPALDHEQARVPTGGRVSHLPGCATRSRRCRGAASRDTEHWLLLPERPPQTSGVRETSFSSMRPLPGEGVRELAAPVHEQVTVDTSSTRPSERWAWSRFCLSVRELRKAQPTFGEACRTSVRRDHLPAMRSAKSRSCTAWGQKAFAMTCGRDDGD